MGFFTETIEYEPKGYTRLGAPTGKIPTKRTGFSGVLTPAIFIFLGWLILGGLVAWSRQTQILVIIGLGIWWLSK